jgi:AraC family ethanolamine operon transcriptional activator
VEATGASQRMLEYHFRRIYGVTPQTWFRCMKLNALRRDLLHARATGERISDIAMRWGFLHLGRFSEEYRRLFGESPRDTSQR